MDNPSGASNNNTDQQQLSDMSAQIVSSIATATPITSEIVTDFEPDPKFDITPLEMASYDCQDIYTTTNLTEEQHQQQPLENNGNSDQVQIETQQHTEHLTQVEQVLLVEHQTPQTVVESYPPQPPQQQQSLGGNSIENALQQANLEPSPPAEELQQPQKNAKQTSSSNTTSNDYKSDVELKNVAIDAVANLDNSASPAQVGLSAPNDLNLTKDSTTPPTTSKGDNEQVASNTNRSNPGQLNFDTNVDLSADQAIKNSDANAYSISQTSADAQMEKVLANIVQLGGVHQFPQSLGQPEHKEELLASIHREITSDRSSIDLIADVASRQQSIEIIPTLPLAHEPVIEEKILEETVTEEKGIEEKLTSDKLVEEKIVEEKLVEQQLEKEQTVEENVIEEKIIEEKVDEHENMEEEVIGDKNIVEQVIEDKGNEEIIVNSGNVEEIHQEQLGTAKNAIVEVIEDKVVEAKEMSKEQGDAGFVKIEANNMEQKETPVLPKKDSNQDDVVEKSVAEKNSAEAKVVQNEANLKESEKDKMEVVEENIGSEETADEKTDVKKQSAKKAVETRIEEKRTRSIRTRGKKTDDKVIEEPRTVPVLEQPKSDLTKSDERPVDKVTEDPVQEMDAEVEQTHEQKERQSRSLRPRGSLKRKHDEDSPKEDSPKVEQPKKQLKRSRNSTSEHTPMIKLPNYRSRTTISSSDPISRLDKKSDSTSGKIVVQPDTEKKFVCHQCGYATDRLNNLVYHSTKSYCEGKLQMGEVMKADIIKQQQQAKNKRRSIR